MPFIGQEPLTGAYHVLDAITTSATATYNLQLNSGAFSPATANQLLVSLNGVIQKPGSSFTISGSQITFSSALTSSDSIDFIIALGDVLSVGTPTDGAVSTNKIANDAVTGAKIENNPTIAGNLGVNGITTSVGTIVASSGVAIGGTGVANTLDDYEEGTWTATYGSSGSDTGVYTKIGRLVHVHVILDAASQTIASGVINGLPFAVENTLAAGSIGRALGMGGQTRETIGIGAASSYLQIHNAGGGANAITTGSGTVRFDISLTYFTTA